MTQPLLVFGLAFVSTLLGSMSGGSASLLTTPSWLALGFPLPTAVAADKIAGTMWTLVGARTYLRGRPVDGVLVSGMIAVGALGAYLGTAVTTSVDPAPLKRIVGGLVLTGALVVFARPRFGREAGPARLPRAAVTGAALPLGFYEGLLGSGNSIAVTLLLSAGRGLDLLSALGHYYAIAAAWCGFAALAYAARGVVSLALSVPATLGAVAGGYVGSRLGRRGGTGFVRALFVLAGLGLGLKLLLGF